MEQILSLTVVLPSWNDGEVLPQSVVAILRECPGAEIVAVIDGVRESSAAIAARIESMGRVRVLVHERRLGKGFAVRDGVLAGNGDLIVITDADVPIDPALFRRFAAVIESDPSVDGVIGYRTAYQTNVLRHITHRAYHLLVRLLLGIPYRDTQTPMKVFRAAAAKELFGSLQTPGYAFDVEVLSKALRSGKRLHEEPVHQMRTQSGMRLRHVVSMLLETLDIFAHMYRRGWRNVFVPFVLPVLLVLKGWRAADHRWARRFPGKERSMTLPVLRTESSTGPF